jgi:hypothetical protein
MYMSHCLAHHTASSATLHLLHTSHSIKCNFALTVKFSASHMAGAVINFKQHQVQICTHCTRKVTGIWLNQLAAPIQHW